VLSHITADEYSDASEELARYLDAGLTTTRELLAAVLNDLDNECLPRWGPGGEVVPSRPQLRLLSNPKLTTSTHLDEQASTSPLARQHAARLSSPGGVRVGFRLVTAPP
jgi:hypothetical protein